MQYEIAKAKVITAYSMRVGGSDNYMDMIGLSDTLSILVGDETMRNLMLDLIISRDGEK